MRTDSHRSPAGFTLDSFHSLLIVKMSSIGDVVQALPVASALRRRYPMLRITWAAENWTTPLLIDHPAIDRVVAFPKMAFAHASAKPALWLGNFRCSVREIQSEAYDVCLDLQGLLKSSLVATLSKARLRLGIDGQREGAKLISRAIPTRAPGRHAVLEYLAAAEYLGAPSEPIDFGLRPRPDAVASVQRVLARHGSRPIVVINPSASSPRKTWPQERWADLIDLLSDHVQPVLAGTIDQRARHAAIARSARRPPLDLTGQTSLDELTALLSRCAVHIAPDTGSAHIAAALGRPVVGIYGPTPAWRLGPFGQAHLLIDRSDVCGAWCPRFCARNRQCLRSISAAEVAQRVSLALAAKAGNPSFANLANG